MLQSQGDPGLGTGSQAMDEQGDRADQHTFESMSELVFPSASPLAISRDDLARALKEQRAQGAYVELHPLGFLNVPVSTPDRLKEGIYLHIFPEQRLPRLQPETPIHTHSFVLESRILCGALGNTMYDVSFDPDSPHSLYEIRFAGETTARHYVGNVSYTPISEEIHPAGTIYTIPVKRFHSTVETGCFTATLMLKRDIDYSYNPLAIVAGERAPFDSATFDRKHFSNEEGWNLVQRVIDEMCDL